MFDVRVKVKLKLSYLNADAIESECDSVIRCSDVAQDFNLEGSLIPPSSAHLAPPPAYPSPPPSLSFVPILSYKSSGESEVL